MAETTVERILEALRVQISKEDLEKCEAWFIKAFQGYVYKLQNEPETPRLILSCYTVSELDRALGKTKLPVGWRSRQHVAIENLALFFHETILSEGFEKLDIQAQMKRLSSHSKRDKRGYERYFDAYPNLNVEVDWLREENAVKV